MAATKTGTERRNAGTRQDPLRVGASSTVEIDRGLGEREVWRIDPAGRSDPDHGVIGVDTALARALLGAEQGDIRSFTVASREWEVVVTRILTG